MRIEIEDRLLPTLVTAMDCLVCACIKSDNYRSLSDTQTDLPYIPVLDVKPCYELIDNIKYQIGDKQNEN